MKRIEIWDYYADYSKFNKATGWKPLTTLTDGLKETVKYYVKHKKRYW